MKWEVKFRVDLGYTKMRNELYELIEQERDGDVCMFAFIWHGVAVHGNHYLVAQDALLQRTHKNANNFESEVLNSCIDLNFVQQVFGCRRHGKHPTLFLLDCCRSC